LQPRLVDAAVLAVGVSLDCPGLLRLPDEEGIQTGGLSLACQMHSQAYASVFRAAVLREAGLRFGALTGTAQGAVFCMGLESRWTSGIEWLPILLLCCHLAHKTVLWTVVPCSVSLRLDA